MFVLGACASADAPTPTALPEGVRPVNPPIAVPEFTLLDQVGNAFTRTEFLGSWTVVTFGFTHCPDVCPINLANFTLTKRALGDQAEAVRFMFVSVDGERDTPEVLSKHIALFDTSFIGLTGSDNAVRPLTQAFGVRYEIVRPEGTQADYLVDHTASWFLVNPQGQIWRIYTYGTAPEVIAEDLQTNLKAAQ